jgi:hypothetical protein
MNIKLAPTILRDYRCAAVLYQGMTSVMPIKPIKSMLGFSPCRISALWQSFSHPCHTLSLSKLNIHLPKMP